MKNINILHPYDASTGIFASLYYDLNYTPVDSPIYGERHLFIGHGSPSGLFGRNTFPNYGNTLFSSAFCVSSDNVEALKGVDNIYIRCHANKFFDEHNLTGFTTGMFISEVGEAMACGLTGISQRDVDISNLLFCKIVHDNMYQNKKVLLRELINNYKSTIGNTQKVIDYNKSRFKIR